MTTPEIPVPLFLQAVRRRPEVWTPTGPEQADTKRAAAAWKQICRSTWPEFDSWTVEQKRTRCKSYVRLFPPETEQDKSWLPRYFIVSILTVEKARSN